MKKGEIYEGIIEKVDFPNKGYVNIDGEKVIVKICRILYTITRLLFTV